MAKRYDMIVSTIIIVLFIIYFAIPFGKGFMDTFKLNTTVSEKLDGASEISIATEDGVTLSAWYAKSSNNEVIILVHDAYDNKADMIKYANDLISAGYGVLVFDMRAHGDSNGDGVNAYNWNSEKDLDAVINYLKLENSNVKIGALGIGLGADILLSYAYKDEISAMVVDGATYRTTNDYKAIDKYNNIIHNFRVRLEFISASLFGGMREPESAINSLSNVEDTKFLFITSSEEDERLYNNNYYNLVKDNSTLWEIDNCKHLEGYDLNSKEYMEKVLSFFSDNL
ncbi:MAG: alpha/beta hydrolase [Bacilli bacterium]|nr:alpha/beta hydrolase [Bacilli bacterium]